MSSRKDTSDPRQRLLDEATLLFAERGYDAVTTREICANARLNPGAIHYHFGDKDGLYGEVLRRLLSEVIHRFTGFDDPALSLHQALYRFLSAFLSTDGGCDTRLHLREMLAPSAVFLDIVQREITPHFMAFNAVLARHIGTDPGDVAVQQLAMGLQAMAHDYSLSRPIMNAMNPTLLADDPQLTQLCTRLADWGCALVAHERQRRST